MVGLMLLLPGRVSLHWGRIDGSKGSYGYLRDFVGGHLFTNMTKKTTTLLLRIFRHGGLLSLFFAIEKKIV